MSEKLDKKRKQAEDVAESEISQAVTTMQTDAEKQQAWMVVGGLKVVNHLQSSLNAQLMRGLQFIRDNKGFEALGYTRFDDFLDNDENSPMSYKSFNEREKLLLREGDAAFDVLTQVGLSLRKRKLLGAGHVQIDTENNCVVVVTDQNGEEKIEEFDLADRARLLQTLSAIADQNIVQNQKLNKAKETIKKGEKQVEQLQRELDDAKLRGGIMSVEGVHLEHFLRITNSLKAMTEFVLALPEEEKAKADFYLDEIQAGFTTLQRAYGRTGAGNNAADSDMSKRQIKKISSKTENFEKGEFSEIFDKNDEELADLI